MRKFTFSVTRPFKFRFLKKRYIIFPLKGGNDYEIFSHPRVKGHTVTGPEDTVKQLNELFFKK